MPRWPQRQWPALASAPAAARPPRAAHQPSAILCLAHTEQGRQQPRPAAARAGAQQAVLLAARACLCLGAGQTPRPARSALADATASRRRRCRCGTALPQHVTQRSTHAHVQASTHAQGVMTEVRPWAPPVDRQRSTTTGHIPDPWSQAWGAPAGRQWRPRCETRRLRGATGSCPRLAPAARCPCHACWPSASASPSAARHKHPLRPAACAGGWLDRPASRPPGVQGGQEQLASAHA